MFKRLSPFYCDVRIQNLLPSATKSVHLLKGIFGNLHGFSRAANILWEATKPAIILKEEKSVTRCFWTKENPQALWNAFDYMLQFNFRITHIAGSVNTEAAFLSRLRLRVTEKIRLKIQEGIQTTPIDVTTSSSEVTDEEQFFFTQPDNESESEEQTD